MRWRIGPAQLWIERQPREWVIRSASEGDPFSDELEVVANAPLPRDDELSGPAQRFAGLPEASQHVDLRPRLADRDVVSRPEKPFWVIPGSTLTGYVGSPLWLGIALEANAAPVIELPLVRLSDTWFGRNTRDGKLCYASRTRLRLRQEDVRWSPHRAVTEVCIRNFGSTPLRIERIKVPVPGLGLWVDSAGIMRTSQLTLTREDDDDELADIQVDDAIPRDAEQLAEPRSETPRGLVRAFSRLL